MNTALQKPCTAFEGYRRVASGPLHEVAIKVKSATVAGAVNPLYIYDDATGRVIDLDIRGSAEEVIARLERQIAPEVATPGVEGQQDVGIEQVAAGERGRGRPKLGVVAHEVTLLPRHWDWLSAQPGGASVALRKLVELARRTNGDRDRRRSALEAAYSFISAIAGNQPGFGEATRALFAYDRRKFGELVAAWPEDVRDHAIKLAFSDLEPSAN